jgi:hypothetical protein
VGTAGQRERGREGALGLGKRGADRRGPVGTGGREGAARGSWARGWAEPAHAGRREEKVGFGRLGWLLSFLLIFFSFSLT